jgi:predicted site-specific integrase-resolvase
MKLSEWAKKVGVSYKTAWRWFRDGKLPVEASQTATGTIIVKEEEKSKREIKEVAIYGRVSSADQKGDLDRQVARLVAYANENGWAVRWTVTEIGSGMNGRRGKLIKLLADEKIEAILIEHRDRLMRFGSEYVEATLVGHGRRLIIVDNQEVENDLVVDMISVLTSFCARLYGKKSAKNKAKRAIETILEDKAK